MKFSTSDKFKLDAVKAVFSGLKKIKKRRFTLGILGSKQKSGYAVIVFR